MTATIQARSFINDDSKIKFHIDSMGPIFSISKEKIEFSNSDSFEKLSLEELDTQAYKLASSLMNALLTNSSVSLSKKISICAGDKKAIEIAPNYFKINVQTENLTIKQERLINLVFGKIACVLATI